MYGDRRHGSFRGQVAIDIILAEDGKYYVDSTPTMDGEVVSAWTDGPFETEAKARECLQRQHAVPTLERGAKD